MLEFVFLKSLIEYLFFNVMKLHLRLKLFFKSNVFQIIFNKHEKWNYEKRFFGKQKCFLLIYI